MFQKIRIVEQDPMIRVGNLSFRPITICHMLGGANMKVSVESFLKGSDLEEQVTECTISNVEKVAFSDREAVVVHLEIGDRTERLVLNNTNLKRLISSFGDETDEWTGQALALEKVRVTNPNTGTEVDGIRIKQ